MTTGLYSQHLNDRKKLYIRNTVLALMLILFALIAIFPIFYMIMSSFGPAVATAGTSRSVIPRRFTLDSYKAFFSFNRSRSSAMSSLPHSRATLFQRSTSKAAAGCSA